MINRRGKSKISHYNFSSKNNRGQLTIFIIIAVVIVGIVALFFVLKDNLKTTSGIPTSIEPLYTSILSCLEDTSKEGISYISAHGGYYDVPEAMSISYFTENIPYYYFNSKTYVPSKDRVEKELANYISENLYKCADLDSFREQGFNISEKNISSSTTINEEDIVVKMVYPLSVKKGESTTQLKNFETKINSQLSLLLDTSKEVVTSYSEKPGFVCLTCLEEISNKNNLNITATPMENLPKGNVIWFSILEREDSSLYKLKLVFVVEQ